ncbi:16439_t:CDS:2 [Funneliformis geosporum]|nr:16439_t:CDS:2 [Funneliformis geosporum]
MDRKMQLSLLIVVTEITVVFSLLKALVNDQVLELIKVEYLVVAFTHQQHNQYGTKEKYFKKLLMN